MVPPPKLLRFIIHLKLRPAIIVMVTLADNVRFTLCFIIPSIMHETFGLSTNFQNTKNSDKTILQKNNNLM